MAYNQLIGLVQQAESGGKDYDARGNVVTSPSPAGGAAAWTTTAQFAPTVRATSTSSCARAGCAMLRK